MKKEEYNGEIYEEIASSSKNESQLKGEIILEKSITLEDVTKGYVGNRCYSKYVFQDYMLYCGKKIYEHLNVYSKLKSYYVKSKNDKINYENCRKAYQYLKKEKN